MNEKINVTVNRYFIETITLIDENESWVIIYEMNSGNTFRQFYGNDFEKAKKDYLASANGIENRISNNKI